LVTENKIFIIIGYNHLDPRILYLVKSTKNNWLKNLCSLHLTGILERAKKG